VVSSSHKTDRHDVTELWLLCFSGMDFLEQYRIEGSAFGGLINMQRTS
jgi:hypothetical protein